MKCLAHYIIAFLFIFLLRDVEAQVYPYWQYTTADELSSSTVNDIFQDTRGYLWFATDRGMSRFDGFKFNNYLFTEGLPIARISSLAQNDERKVIAATPYKGVCLFGNNFNLMIAGSNLLPNDQSVAWNDNFYSLKRGEYVSCTEKRTHLSFKLKLDANPHSILLTSNNVVVATDRGLLYVGAKNEIDQGNAIKKPVYSLHRFNDTLFAGGDGAIYLVHGDKLIKEITLPVSGKVRNILRSRSGDLWFSANDGRTLYLWRNQTITDISHQIKIEGTQINRLFEDHEGNIWIATTGKGILCIHHFFAKNYTKLGGLDNEYVTSLAFTADQKLMIGTKDGIFKLESNGVKHDATTGGLTIFKMYCNDKDCYISSDAAPVKKIGEYQLSDHLPELDAITPEQLNTVLNVLHQGRRKLDLPNTASYQTRTDSLKLLTIINDIFIDKSNVLWIATNIGLLSSAQNVNTTDTSFLKSNISCIIQNKRGDLFFGTDNGLAKYANGKWKFFRQIQGKSVESITSLAEDQKSRLWIGTLTGLSYWYQDSIMQFDTKNILLSDEINALCYDRVHNFIWAGTSSGLTCIDIAAFDATKIFAPLPMIKSLRTTDSVYRELDLKKEVTIPYNTRNFALRFSAVHFATPEGVKFYYKFDDGEFEPATGRQIEFASIPYGKHKFSIKAVGEHDSETYPAELIVYVQTPFWATTWFKIILGITIAFLAYITIRKRFEVVKKKQQERLELQAKIAELRHQALASSMNPHFIFNALNSIQQFINVHDTEEASEYLGKFARLIRIMLKSGGKTFITLKEELERLNYYLDLEKIRFGSKLNFEIHVDEKLVTEETEIPNMVIQPIVENALWHGLLPANRDGCLKINFSKMNGSIHVLVDDNGIGVNESKKRKKSGHVSLGLQMIEERLALLKRLNGYTAKINILDKSDQTPAEQGTLVDIVLN